MSILGTLSLSQWALSILGITVLGPPKLYKPWITLSKIDLLPNSWPRGGHSHMDSQGFRLPTPIAFMDHSGLQQKEGDPPGSFNCSNDFMVIKLAGKMKGLSIFFIFKRPLTSVRFQMTNGKHIKSKEVHTFLYFKSIFPEGLLWCSVKFDLPCNTTEHSWHY